MFAGGPPQVLWISSTTASEAPPPPHTHTHVIRVCPGMLQCFISIIFLS